MIKKLRIILDFGDDSPIFVGEMLRTDRGEIYFQFDPKFLTSKLAISPIKLKPLSYPQRPLEKELHLFDGIFGVFADSLPDGWGLMMMSRAMKKRGLDFSTCSPLDQLSFVGHRAMGALSYEPAIDNVKENPNEVDLSVLATEVDRVLGGEAEEVLTELAVMGGSPGGARPKVLVGVKRESGGKTSTIISGVENIPDKFEHWMIKFRGRDEILGAGIVEYIYSVTANKVGLNVPESTLFYDRLGNSWFGVKRFDRGPHGSRLHMHTVAGIAHANYRLPSMDYEDFLKITFAITRNQKDLLQAFRLACFNVIFHNRDDHAKNFAFIMSKDGVWQLAPAYDLTYTLGPGGEHTTAILGEGRDPQKAHLLKLAEKIGINKSLAQEIVDEVNAGRSYMLNLFKQHEISNHPLKKYLTSTS